MPTLCDSVDIKYSLCDSWDIKYSLCDSWDIKYSLCDSWDIKYSLCDSGDIKYSLCGDPLKSTGIWSTYLICIFLLSTHNKFLRVVTNSIKLNGHKIIYM
jgi:hypothetical protein